MMSIRIFSRVAFDLGHPKTRLACVVSHCLMTSRSFLRRLCIAFDDGFPVLILLLVAGFLSPPDSRLHFQDAPIPSEARCDRDLETDTPSKAAFRKEKND